MKRKKKRKAVCISILLVLLFCVGCSTEDGTNVRIKQKTEEASAGSVSGKEKGPEEPSAEASEHTVSQGSITVYVCGGVVRPGIYTVDGSARMMAAVEAAGGMTPEADADALNLAQYMTDGQMIRVPLQGEAQQQEENMGEPEAMQDGRIDLNTADAAQLMTIPGVGQSKADAILQYRQEHGKFDKIEDIMQISGIKEASFRKMEPYICVR